MILSPTLNDEVRESHELGSAGQYPIVTRWLDVSPVATEDSVRRELAEPNESDESGEHAPENSDNTITFRASVESEDRAGDVIRAEGWELDNYRLNPVVSARPIKRLKIGGIEHLTAELEVVTCVV